MDIPTQKQLILDFIKILHKKDYDVVSCHWSPMAERNDAPNIDFLDDDRLISWLDNFLANRNLDKRDIL